MNQSFYNFIIAVAGGLLAILIAGGTFFFLQKTKLPPVVYHKLEILNTQPVAPGDDLRVQVYRTKHRICPATYDYFIMPSTANNTAGHILTWGSVPSVYSPVGDGPGPVLVVHLPLDTPSGLYDFTEFAHIYCPGTDSYHTATPSARFSVR